MELKLNKKTKNKEQTVKDRKTKSVNIFMTFLNYLRASIDEVKLAVWPSWNQVRRNTVVVLTTVMLLGVVLFGMDYGLNIVSDLIYGT